jgi:hypothetical protein
MTLAMAVTMVCSLSLHLCCTTHARRDQASFDENLFANCCRLGASASVRPSHEHPLGLLSASRR